MSKLSVKKGSVIEDNMYTAWCGSSGGSWVSYVKSLDENIIKVRYNFYNSPLATDIWFKDDATKTWFILRWS